MIELRIRIPEEPLSKLRRYSIDVEDVVIRALESEVRRIEEEGALGRWFSEGGRP
jgi:hypothetical protein